MLDPVGEEMNRQLGVGDGGRHLDVASGTGEPGLTIARRAPGARVVLSDLSEGMLRIAHDRARAEGLVNVGTRICSADDLPYDDASFDTGSVRFGYTFFPDPDAATAELVRVLADGGRVCAAVWAEPGTNPWISIIMDAIAAEVPQAPPDPGAPHLFRFDSPGAIGAVFDRAGLHQVVECDVPIELVAASPEEYWEIMGERVSPAAVTLRAVDREIAQRIRGRAILGAALYVRDGVVRLPGLARCTVATAAG